MDIREKRYKVITCTDEILKRISEKNKKCVVAIDGRSAAGKTTLATFLSDKVRAPIIHMDDFFLPPELRTDERFSEPGGNVHYERFAEEVLPCLSRQEDFEYRIFDCGSMRYNETAFVPCSDIYIVEGSYCLHPVFGDYADIKVFCDIDSRSQLERIVKRNGALAAETFKSRWIPFEEKYFNEYNIRDTVDFIFRQEDNNEAEQNF